MRAHAVFLTLLAASIVIGPADARMELLHQERSLYRNIFVTQDGDERCMTFRYPRGLGRQSCKLLNEPRKLVFQYTRMQLSALFLNPNPKHILIVGEGGGTIPAALQEMCPDAQIDVVELDAAVDSVARAFFGFTAGPRMRVHISDGRIFVKRMAGKKPNYDLVLLDAFEADYIPEHMLTREFLQEVKANMAPNGIIVANTFSGSALYDHESVTYRDVFGPYFNLKTANRIILGRRDGIKSDDLVLAQKNAAELEAEFTARGISSLSLVARLDTDIDWNPDARILTDQYSPSNLLNASPGR
jgi:spermidine synthase